MGFINAQVFDGVGIPNTVFYDVPPNITYAVVRDTGAEWKAESGLGQCYVAFFKLSGESHQSDVVSTSLVASKTQGNYVYMHNTLRACTQPYTYENKTVYYGFGGGASGYDKERGDALVTPLVEDQLSNERRARIAWLMAYGGTSGYTVTYVLTHCTGSDSNPTHIEADVSGTTCFFNPENRYSFNSGSVAIDGVGEDGGAVSFSWQPETGVLTIGIIQSNITVRVTAYGDPYQDIDGGAPLPGDDIIPVPNVPGLSITSAGIIGLFKPTIAQMRLLGDSMWTNIPDTGATVEVALNEITQALKRSISNPLNYVVGLNIIPSQGLTTGSNKRIRFGFIDSGVEMPELASQYFNVNCGTINFPTVCGNTFLDYAPYAKFSIYLPYIGVKDIDANDFVGHSMSVQYRGDVVTGGITAYVLKDDSVMYQYSGCCALNVPLTADNWGNTISGAVQIATSIVAGAVTGGAAGVAAGAAKGAASVAANPSQLSPQVLRSGAVSGGAGCMAVQYPFVIRQAVSFHDTKGFNTVSGYPSYYYKRIGDMHGFTTCYDVHLQNVPATNEEKSEIERLLKEGVIL